VMPGMDGFDVMNVLKEDPGFSGTRIIGVSAAVSPSSRKKEFIDACDDFMSKPIDVDLLLEKIQAQIGISWQIIPPGPQLAVAGTGRVMAPAATTLDAMQQIVRNGDYGALEQMLDNLEKEEPAYGGFCEIMRTFINRYDDEGIIAYLHKVRERADGDNS